jgi:hypothetical protein
MTISDALKQKVRERAGNRCEYCLSHQDYVMSILQIDHAQPVSRGGTDTEDNLCLACDFCNQYKWAKVEAIDPESGERVALFNPRLQEWRMHFNWSREGTEIEGLTACGRATIVALRLNNRLAVTVRQNWVRAGWHPPES